MSQSCIQSAVAYGLLGFLVGAIFVASATLVYTFVIKLRQSKKQEAANLEILPQKVEVV
jgi:hypothetical protein